MLTAYKIGLALALALTLVYAFQNYYSEYISPLSSIASVFIAGAAAVFSGFALRRYGRSTGKFSLIWVCFTAGMTLWFLGELGYATYAIALNVEIPYPSIADAFWLAGYVPLSAALYLYVKMFTDALSKKTLVIVLSTVAVMSTLVSIGLVLPTIGAEGNMVTFAVNLAYPLLDLALFSTALLGLAVFQRGELGKSWLLMSAGILFNVSGDFLFSYTTARGVYYNGHPIDLPLLYGYILFLLAFCSHIKEL